MDNTSLSISRKDDTEIKLLYNAVSNATAQIIFAHGAGANMSHEFMDKMTTLLNNEGINVLRFNFPFMDKRAETGKKYPPDRMPKLLSCYRDVIEHNVNHFTDNDLPLFIGGKSMGSRVAASLIASPEILGDDLLSHINGVFCIGYPFHPTKKPDKLRLEPLVLGRKPTLIVQGERDSLGTQIEIATYQLPGHCHCVFLEDGDHSLKPRVKSGFTLSSHMERGAREISLFIAAQQG